MKKPMVQIGLGMGLYNVSGMLSGMHTGVKSFNQAQALAASGQEIPVDVYAGMIGGSVKKVKESTVFEMAEQCFKQKLKPTEVLNLVESTFYKPQKPVLGPATENVLKRRAMSATPQLAQIS
jgi:hypothetical protein